MPQNCNFQQLHFAISNLEVSKLEITVKVELRQVHEVPPVPPQKYLIPKEIAKHLNEMTGEKWTYPRVIETLAQMGYITKLKDNWRWQPTEKAKHFADFSSRDLKWSPEVINLILQQQPQQLKLAV